jgi:hypothetical protein
MGDEVIPLMYLVAGNAMGPMPAIPYMLHLRAMSYQPLLYFATSQAGLDCFGTVVLVETTGNKRADYLTDISFGECRTE